MKDLDKSLIPIGPYCYTWKELPLKENNFRGKINCCPYWKPKKICGVDVPWCDYLNLGGWPNDWGWTDKDWENVTKFLGGEEEADKKLPLFLLFDQCKECGENDPDE